LIGLISVPLNEAELQFLNQETTPVVLFAGNFNYDLTPIALPDRVSQVKNIIGAWQEDTRIFTDLVDNKILAVQ
jgi:hypothetical protein